MLNGCFLILFVKKIILYIFCMSFIVFIELGFCGFVEGSGCDFGEDLVLIQRREEEVVRGVGVGELGSWGGGLEGGVLWVGGVFVECFFVLWFDIFFDSMLQFLGFGCFFNYYFVFLGGGEEEECL